MGRNHRIGAQLADGRWDLTGAAEDLAAPEAPQRARSSRTRTLPYLADAAGSVLPSPTDLEGDSAGAFEEEAPIPLVQRARISAPPSSGRRAANDVVAPLTGTIDEAELHGPASSQRSRVSPGSFPPPSLEAPPPSSQRRAVADDPMTAAFFRAQVASQSDDDDLWPIDPIVLEVWMQRRGRRRAVKAIGWLGVVAAIAGVAFLGATPSASKAIASWATMGQLEPTQLAVLRAKLKGYAE